ncbi:endonuclease domain-containing protein [Dietzia cercidiphylli]|uniref:endonuclease domain-containing protein n=1 Tax=Dietzia cercidiphylli TaxID=498199 RepID=UPI00223BDC9B|nr:endonuclease domain-containing protein [Dietzia cercidiphylli]MCT1515424.1 endonuclease domain-containing protein [Dietzia cercidiphylli]
MATRPNGPRRRGELLATHGTHRVTSGYRRVHHGIWEPATTVITPITRLAAATLACPGAVATGWVAAAIHGHPWVPARYSIDLAVGRKRVRREGIVARRYEIPEDQVETILDADGAPLRLASPEWALFDLARHAGKPEAMIALDGASWMGPGHDIRHSLPTLLVRHPGLRGRRIALERCAMAEPLTESPMETRLRLFLIDLGLTGFRVQYRTPGLPYRLDFAFPEHKVAVEYDGAGHRDAAQHGNDVRRKNRLRAAGWTVITVTATLFYRRRHELAAQLRAALS